MLEKVVRMGILYHLYGPLLTERQQSLIELYYYQDLSLGEIASEYSISRQAVFDNIRRAEETLETCERQLQFERRLVTLRGQFTHLTERIQPLLTKTEKEKREELETLLKEIMDQLE